MKIRTIKVGSLKTNCHLLLSKGEILVIDPGAESERIIQEINNLNGFLKNIVTTHDHYDHVGAVNELESHFNIEKKTLTKNLNVGEMKLNVIKTPGHTKNSICIIGNDFAFTGDTIFKNDHGRVDLPGGSMESMKKSLDRLSEILRIGMIIYPGHGQSFELKTTDLKNKYIKDA